MTPILQTLLPLAKRHGSKQATDFTQGNACISGSPGDELDAFLSNQGFDPAAILTADRDLLYDAYLDGWDRFFRQRLSLQSVPSDCAPSTSARDALLVECREALAGVEALHGHLYPSERLSDRWNTVQQKCYDTLKKLTASKLWSEVTHNGN